MLRLSRPDIEGHLQTSRPLFARALLSASGMERLFAHLGSFNMVNVRGLVGESEIENATFLEDYKTYVDRLLGGESAPAPPSFTAAIGTSKEDFYAFEVKPERFLIKLARPAIQMRPFSFSFSEKDGTFYPMVCGEGALSWGVEFSFPQIAQLGGGTLIKPLSEGAPQCPSF